MLFVLPLICFSQQQPEQIVRQYVSLLDDFLMSPNSSKRAAFENSKLIEGCLFNDEIYVIYKKDSHIVDCKAKDYAGILADAINESRGHTYANVKIARDLSKSSSGGIYEVTVYLQYTGAIEMRTVTVFHIKDGKMFALTNDFIKTKEWISGGGSKSDPPVSEGQQSGGGSSSSDGHQYVDLGLPSGTLWAACNVGANNPWDYGYYFAWGETTTKSTYSWSNYKYCKDGDYHKLTKYCNRSDYGNNGYTDSRTTLERSDDAAYQNWGSDWCMPTQAQFQELLDNCTNEWTTNYQGKGVAGRIFKSKKNGNTIFFPAAGYKGSDGKPSYVGSYGYYWSSSLGTDYPGSARSLYFDSSNVSTYGDYRRCGSSVRPVRCKN